jgi:hypothetical protein
MASEKPRLIGRLLTLILFAGALFLVGGGAFGWATGEQMVAQPAQNNAERSRSAFLSVIPVLRHPRCFNCHSSGDFPRQGDDSHVHAQNVKRGPSGSGKYGERCSTCHQDHNVDGLNMPPGAPNWHLPPPSHPMIWEGKTPGEICRLIKDPKQNGDKSLAAIVEHATSDKLVLWGWSPGEGRTVPPLSHEEFAQQISEWAKYGAACPD